MTCLGYLPLSQSFLRLSGKTLTAASIFGASHKMYRPNFCSECGAKIIRLHWYTWTSRRFCSTCSHRLLKERFAIPLVVSALLFGIGLGIGRAAKSQDAPLIIERIANSLPTDHASATTVETVSDSAQTTVSSGNASEVQQPRSGENVYICGARTKKGKPCSRRLPEPVRCWQHKGMPAMLPPEKLIVRDQ